MTNLRFGGPADDGADEFAAAPEESAGPGQNGAIDVRTNFDALAVFEPEGTTASDGTATIDVPLPDNLTRYRVMVVAVDDIDQLRLRRIKHHRPLAPDGPALRSTIPQLR